MFVEREALITLATETADRVLASSVQAHSRELDAFVDILPVREASPSWTQLLMRVGTWLRTGLASFATPSTAHGTATKTLRKLSVYGVCALSVSIVQVTGLLSRVYARGV